MQQKFFLFVLLLLIATMTMNEKITCIPVHFSFKTNNLYLVELRAKDVSLWIFFANTRWGLAMKEKNSLGTLHYAIPYLLNP